MRTRPNPGRSARGVAAAWLLAAVGGVAALPTRAHCDTLNGPVVKAGRAALAAGNLAPVLKRLKREYESEVREPFGESLAARIVRPAAGTAGHGHHDEGELRPAARGLTH